MTDVNRTKLYLITPPKLDLAIFPSILERTFDAGDVACIQLRLKDSIEDDIRQAINILKPIAQDRGIAFLLNDDPLMAAETACDGVHIGQEDATYFDAREAVGQNAIVGVTCHASRHLGMEAAEKGADYVAFGAFFETKTKIPKHYANFEILKWWCEDMTVPAIAISEIRYAPDHVDGGTETINEITCQNGEAVNTDLVNAARRLDDEAAAGLRNQR